jgi:uncharacterized protein YeaO (DUF488 family)
MIKIKRIYDELSNDDGYRILIDRLWPRGCTKQQAAVDLWMKDIAPSNELRQWFSHDATRWKEFQKRYKEELKTKKEMIDKILAYEQEKKTITLLYAAKDQIYNNAVVLHAILENK